MYAHAMLDLETYATTPDAVILSIGVQLFDPQHYVFGKPALGPGFYIALDREEQVTPGKLYAARRVDPSTVAWWEKQSKEAREVFNHEQVRVGIALAALDSFLAREAIHRDGLMMWGNGSDFDNVLLGDLYKWREMKAPWKYHNSRCFRTLKNLLPADYDEFCKAIPRITHHNALDDARWQAEIAVRMLKRIERAPEVCRAVNALKDGEGCLGCISPGQERDDLEETIGRYENVY